MTPDTTDYQAVFNELANQAQQIDDIGEVASYIPELQRIDSDKFGIHLTTVDNRNFGIGDSNEKFSIQSISKVLSLVLAIKLVGGKLWQRVRVEPSGTPFNSLIQLELEKGIPRNPFINAGAIVVCDVLVSLLDDPKQQLIEFVREINDDQTIDYNIVVAESERKTSYTNIAHINLMKAHGNIYNDIDTVLELYFHLCSIEMDCCKLAQTFLFLASQGVNPLTKKQVLTVSASKRINAIMQTCGFYDEAGEFSFKVGLPGKSGVGGGIIAIRPGKYCIAVWSPKLNAKGNSYKGMKILEYFTTRTQCSIF
ncbi:MAG: glutaminase [Psychrosphaera sp.]|nr:glutaminase [Psychrosphaera sp.]